MLKSMFSIVLMALSAAAALPAAAAALTCSDAHAALKYETYVQVGGPCCGRGSSTLTYQGVVIKQTEHINGGGPFPGKTTDTDPALLVQEGARMDLGNSSSDRPSNRHIAFVAMNLTLERTDGKPALPGGIKATEVVSVVCEVRSELFPVP